MSILKDGVLLTGTNASIGKGTGVGWGKVEYRSTLVSSLFNVRPTQSIVLQLEMNEHRDRGGSRLYAP